MRHARKHALSRAAVAGGYRGRTARTSPAFLCGSFTSLLFIPGTPSLRARRSSAGSSHSTGHCRGDSARPSVASVEDQAVVQAIAGVGEGMPPACLRHDCSPEVLLGERGRAPAGNDLCLPDGRPARARYRPCSSPSPTWPSARSASGELLIGRGTGDGARGHPHQQRDAHTPEEPSTSASSSPSPQCPTARAERSGCSPAGWARARKPAPPSARPRAASAAAAALWRNWSTVTSASGGKRPHA